MADKEVILVDSAGWVERDEQGNERHRYGFKGEPVPDTVSAEELTRLRDLGAIGPEDDLAGAVAGGVAGGPTVGGGSSDVADEQLSAMTVEELAGHLGQNPQDAARVRALEQNRDRPRKTVLEMADKVEEAQAENQAGSVGAAESSTFVDPNNPRV